MHAPQMLIGRHPRKPHRTSERSTPAPQQAQLIPSLFILATQLHVPTPRTLRLSNSNPLEATCRLHVQHYYPSLSHSRERHTKPTASCRRQISSCLHLPPHSCPPIARSGAPTAALEKDKTIKTLSRRSVCTFKRPPDCVLE
jgi:hypothetical protein